MISVFLHSGRVEVREVPRPRRLRGLVVVKSPVHDPVHVDMAPVVVNEIQLPGSRCGRFEPALRLLRRRKVNRLPIHFRAVSTDLPAGPIRLAAGIGEAGKLRVYFSLGPSF